MQFDDINGPRAQLALQMLSDGKAVNFRGLGLQLNAAGAIECRVFSLWQPKNVTEAIAREELSMGQGTFEQLLEESSSLAAWLQLRPRVWSLLADYGNGAVRLCSLEGQVIRWHGGLPRGESPS